MASALVKTGVVANVGSFHCVNLDPDHNVETLDGSSGTLYKVEIDNTANDVAVYVKLFDTTGSVTIGTDSPTQPEWVFMCPANVARTYSSPTGTSYGAGLKAVCVTTAGAASGSVAASTAPGASASYKILIST
mgnify:FL=1|tara:strand:- start:468 stop:866 length:399 start_codon:yes stop_codon:yes gene_type:complete